MIPASKLPNRLVVVPVAQSNAPSELAVLNVECGKSSKVEKQLATGCNRA
jgi:hypothetical protein